MSVIAWSGGAGVTRQLNTITPVASNNATYTVTINGKDTTYLADASATVAEITAGLVAALRAAALPEFTGCTFTDITTALTITGPVDGRPFTQTSSASGGSLTTVATTAAIGPNSFAVAANWVGGVAPTASDDVVIDKSDVSILDGLSAASALFSSVTIGAGFTGTIGLPTRNPDGYAEYRSTRLAIQGTAINIGQGQGNGSGRIALQTFTAAFTLTVYSTGSPLDQGIPALLVRDNGTSGSVASILGGSVGFAVLPGTLCTMTTLNVGAGGNNTIEVWGGTGLTLTTLNMDGGSVDLQAGFTTLNQRAGTMTMNGNGAVTTINLDGGTIFWNSSGTITALKIGAGGTFDKTNDPRAMTVTNCTINAGGTLLDPYRTITFTNPIVLNRCSISEVTLSLGEHLTLAVAAGA